MKRFLQNGSRWWLCLVLVVPLMASGQTPKESLSLSELLQLSEAQYPLLKSKKLDVQAAQAGLDASKSTLISTLDASYQVNFATYNNITGMAYPQYLIPISGPPSSGNNFGGVFGSAASLLLNWQPITFGQREAQEGYAHSGLEYAQADERNEVFHHQVKVLNASLDALTADALLHVLQNNLERTGANLQAARSLVISGIRPGVDSALVKAEVSRAKVELLQGRRERERADLQLMQLLATDKTTSISDSLFFSVLPSDGKSATAPEHPMLQVFQAPITMSHNRSTILLRTLRPTFGVWGTTYARGTGIAYNGQVAATVGLGFQRFNYGLGFQLSMPLLQHWRSKPLVQQQAHKNTQPNSP